ncbi:MAG: SAM-dependent chlorinase/fluorinase, partial [Planctomycetes bacterium]|nr:SAM-dependent chlorinase/fluorinase [Planctomycetota bacterium]
MREGRLFVLTTDFGLRDPYVAQVKGVILSEIPEATFLDLTHEIPPQDVRHGAWVLRTSYAWCPAGAIHLAVVDPKVGTARRILAARAHGQMWVGPDNGLLSWVLRTDPNAQVHSVENPALRRPHVSSTFQGRDIMAPSAARLARGAPLAELGPRVDRYEQIPWPEPSTGAAGTGAAGNLRGQVLLADRFGNLITNIDAARLDAWMVKSDGRFRARIAGREARGLVTTYADGEYDEAIALLGSHGFLEIAVSLGSAAGSLRAGPDAEVVLEHA